MRALVLLALAAFVASTASATASSVGRTELTVTYWRDGGEPTGGRVWTLRCDPPRGTLARPRVACRRLVLGGWKLMRPVPEKAVCTEIYGGPQVARIVGFAGGRRVWARFTRQNGCQIARWDRLSPWLLPPGGVTR